MNDDNPRDENPLDGGGLPNNSDASRLSLAPEGQEDFDGGLDINAAMAHAEKTYEELDLDLQLRCMEELLSLKSLGVALTEDIVEGVLLKLLSEKKVKEAEAAANKSDDDEDLFGPRKKWLI